MSEATAGSTFQREIPLNSQASSHVFQTPPTIASGDFKRSIVTAAGTVGAWTNLDNLPTIDPAGSASVKIILSAAETTAAGAGGHINVLAVDASGAEWDSIWLTIPVEASPTNARAADIQSRIPAALVSGRIDSSVGAIAANAITANAIATGAIDADALATDAVAEIVAAMTAPDNAGIAAIKAKTDNLPTDPADQSILLDALTTIAAYIDTEIAAIKAKTDNLPASPAATGDIPSIANIWAHVVEGTLTAEQLLRVMLAAMAGKSTGGGTTTPAFRDVADAKNRIAAVVDNDGNRTTIVLDGT